MGYSEADNIFYLNTIRIKAARWIYYKYRINRFELETLTGLSTHMQLTGLCRCSVGCYVKWLGIANSLRLKTQGYLQGLLRREYIIKVRYNHREKGDMVMISTLGQHILEAYYLEMQKQIDLDAGRVNKPGFRSQGVHPDELSTRYPKFARI